MITREQVEAVLTKVRPYLQADGGDIELVEVTGNSAGVRLTGVCSGCPSAAITLQFGVENGAARGRSSRRYVRRLPPPASEQ
jgi:Fe-S cluster biogenesis protein NfuA